MTSRRFAFLVVALLTGFIVAMPAAVSASEHAAAVSAAKKVRAQLKKCGPLKKKAAKRACAKANKARKIVARQVAGYALVGARGDGMVVDWRHCANGRWVHYGDHPSYGRSSSDGKSWRITHAVVRKGGKWFDAVLSQPVKGGRMEVGIARRGKKWQVAIASFGTDLSSYGDVKRTKIRNRDCVKPS